MAETSEKKADGIIEFNSADHSESGHGSDHIDLNSNLEARIKNPLKGIPHAKLMSDVALFAQEKGLVEYTEVLQKGALVAQDPHNYEDIQDSHKLTDEEVTLLRNEVLHKWSQPLVLYLTIFVCSIGAAVQGWDQTGSNGANLSFPKEFGIATPEGAPFNVYNEMVVGLANAAPYLGSAFVGCWLSDPLNNFFGRRGTIAIAAVFCIIPVIGSALTHSWWEMFICRFLLGLGMGAKGATVPIYAAENSPAAIRGALVMSWQMWTAFGIMLGNAANLALGGLGKIAWRLQLGSAIVPALPLLAMIYFCPESPRWLMKKNRYVDAFASLKKLRFSDLQAARDLYFIHVQLEIEEKIIGHTNFFTRFTGLFSTPRVRRATLASFTVMIAQQMCGINIIAFYSSTIFVEAGFTTQQALLASLGFGIINFVFAFPAFWTIDRFGRRTLLLLTFPNMAWTLLVAGLCNLIPAKHEDGTVNDAHLALIILFIYLFAMFYSPGEGPVPFTYSAEAFPLSHREIGMGFAVATCLFWAAVLTMFLPLMLKSMGSLGVFCFYAGTNVIANVMIFLFVPETAERTLEELDYVFAVPTSTFINYQCSKAFPWFIKRWVLFQKDAILEPLYKFEGGGRNNESSRIAELHANDEARLQRNNEKKKNNETLERVNDSDKAS